MRFSFGRRYFFFLLGIFTLAQVAKGEQKPPLKILPVGDSITRGSYLAHYESGTRQGQPIGLPHPLGGGWRKALQDKLRGAGMQFEFVGALGYGAYGNEGKVDVHFQPRHHGLAGFSNEAIRKGGKVPTPADVLDSLGVKEIQVPDIITVLKKEEPDVILLMSGANGFDVAARDRLIRVVGENSKAHLIVATLPLQQEPRQGWRKVEPYNATLPKTISAQKTEGHKISMVDMYSKLSADDLLRDGVHPNSEGMKKIADVWFQGLVEAGLFQNVSSDVE